MIQPTLELIRRLLNETMENRERRGEDWISLTSLIQADGSPNIAAKNKVVMMVINLSREPGVGQGSLMSRGPGGISINSPPLQLAVDIMFFANFDGANYGDGLAALSQVIIFFQRYNLLTQASAPGLDPALEKVSMEFQNQSPADLSHIFGALGCKYLPCVFYRLRLLPFYSDLPGGRSYPVRGGDGNVGI